MQTKVGGALSITLVGAALLVLALVAPAWGGGSTQVRGNLGSVSISGSLPAGSSTIGNVGVLTINGHAAEDAGKAGTPVGVAGVASRVNRAAVSSDEDVVHAWRTRNGAAVVSHPLATMTTQSDRTADVQVVSAVAGTRIVGFSASESAGTPAACSFVLRHGTGTGDPSFFGGADGIELSANGFVYVGLDQYRLDASAGVFLDVVSGEVSVTVYTVVE